MYQVVIDALTTKRYKPGKDISGLNAFQDSSFVETTLTYFLHDKMAAVIVQEIRYRIVFAGYGDGIFAALGRQMVEEYGSGFKAFYNIINS